MDKQFNQEQLKKIKRLCRECANYDNGLCIVLSDHDRMDIPCVQMISLHLWCNYFIKAVLPINPVLMAELTNDQSKLKKCSSCGKEFAPRGRNHRYCSECSAKIRKQREAERQRIKYHQSTLF